LNETDGVACGFLLSENVVGTGWEGSPFTLPSLTRMADDGHLETLTRPGRACVGGLLDGDASFENLRRPGGGGEPAVP
jgi:hypothetical protein